MHKGSRRVSAAAAAEKNLALDTTELRGSVQVQVDEAPSAAIAAGKKRAREEEDTLALDQPTTKMAKPLDDDGEVPKVDLVDLFAPIGNSAPAGGAPMAILGVPMGTEALVPAPMGGAPAPSGWRTRETSGSGPQADWLGCV